MRLNNKQKELIAQQIVDELNSTLPKINALDYDKVFEKDLELSKKIAKLDEERDILTETREELAKIFNEKLKTKNPDFDVSIRYTSHLIKPEKCLHNNRYSTDKILDKIELASLDAKDVASLIESIKSSL